MKRLRTPLVWGILIALALAAFCVAGRLVNRSEEVSASSFMDMVESGDIIRVTFTASDIVGERAGGRVSVKTRLQEQSHVIAALEERDIPYSDTPPPDYTFWVYAIIITVIVGATVLPLVFFVRMLRSGPMGAGRADSFVKHKALRVESKTGKTFDDVAGIDEAVEEVRDFHDFLQNPKKYERMNARMPKGAILQGPPGTGKTLLAKALAGVAGVPFFFVSAADFVEMFVGVGAARVRNLFEDLKKHEKAMLFIDEIDALSSRRGITSGGGGNDEREATLNALLDAMDGFDNRSGIVVFAATNRPESLDPALVRPGRFDRIITVPLPDINGREAILRIHARGIPLDESVDLSEIARMTPGMSGAGLEQLMNESAILAAKLGLDAVTMDIVDRSVLRVRLGAARESMILTEEERRWIAYHEGGHVLAGWFNEHADPVDKVTCIPHGPGLGWTLSIPVRDVHIHTREYLMSIIERGLGGLVAEKLVFNSTSSGVKGDLISVTDLAEAMVRQFGMADGVGTRSFVERAGGFIDYDLGHRACSEETKRRIDTAIDGIIGSSRNKVERLLEEKRNLLDALVEELLEKETLGFEEIEEVLGPRAADRS